MSYTNIGDARQKTSGYDTYNITNWVKAHYSTPSTDFGIRLEPTTVSSSLNRVCYVSSDYATVNLRPLVIIKYAYQYDLYLQQYYDAGFALRYGGAAAAIDMIETYTQTLHDFYLAKYRIKIHSTISAYTSPADQCTHKNGLDQLCQLELPADSSIENDDNNVPIVCDFHTGTYHCCNWGNMLYTLPAGITTIPKNTKIVKWTGHLVCQDCTYLNPKLVDALGITDSAGTQILVCLGNDVEGYATYCKNFPNENLTHAQYLTQSFTCILAHEFGHTLGCIGDASDTCTTGYSCMMKYNVKDTIKLQLLTGLWAAYCPYCVGFIQSYAASYL